MHTINRTGAVRLDARDIQTRLLPHMDLRLKGEVVAGLQDGEEEGDIHVDIHEEVPTAVALHKSAEYSFDL